MNLPIFPAPLPLVNDCAIAAFPYNQTLTATVSGQAFPPHQLLPSTLYQVVIIASDRSTICRPPEIFSHPEILRDDAVHKGPS